ncbi:MAG: hypothetical protein UR39_C0008G0033 [Candidatus Woesebacteria bacterium GW2011_GWA1_33_30]|uniref:Bacterial Ig domain-containing protein n=1 Tax=Candidatus Woesebacteria bacterium GW2011_GWA2_33_28 TaxID=1618561 RepID=A0A0G0A655_9BACT|nr:MAG: hypothetical protein UR38_C0008G0032 [Candidatus Woesebacteria bacterium GW2011_GWA2_33_28]KKP47588.1 MAG: hypothetical protein UR39_C0008G0033 [Candidatus Woesebacteria bacterium GW2011_GWA1_33_30]KKP49209.1 MAG: hypothetical protein UR40_C0009G0032 [Microgenomates group bacterium GW2011_GWC1_33_32]KKP51701.1 MAG: hypothetical protein UR44_C0007G0032 [Candidatus Woesebacteria bacterium GW2011_GWB1_33_38]KKP58482.1 MAG: hypothetical protein UR48_C0004G0020 [Microgenomates group bacteriu
MAITEERKNIKKAYYYVFLSIVGIVFLIFLGIPTLVKFAGFLGDVAKSDKPVEIQDTTPPAPPQFDSIPEFTNNESIDITGYSENGAVISITANGNLSEIVANNDGKFIFLFNLEGGENKISAIAKDTSGNLSSATKFFVIIFDNTEPELTVLSPKDGDSFYGSGQRQLSIKGTVSEQVDLKINDKFVTLKDDGSFNFTTTLNEGVNSFEVKAIDPSGNESLSSFSVNFTP